MSVKLLYDVQGGDALEKALKDLRAEMHGDEGNLVAKALMKAAYPVWRDAQTRAPTSDPEMGAYTPIKYLKSGKAKADYQRIKHEPGTLRKSIKRQRHSNPRHLSEIVGIGVFVPKGTTRKNDLGPWYAHFVEFGTRLWEGKPFLRPALEANNVRVIREYSQSLGKGIEKAAEKASKKYSNYGDRRTKV